MNNTYTLLLPRPDGQSFTILLAFSNAQSKVIIKKIDIEKK
jgi:hypothetical protein